MSDSKNAFVSVLIDLRLDKALDYQTPQKLIGKLKVGSRVKVPVRGKLCEATVIEVKEAPSYPNPLLIDSLISDDIVVTSELFELANWIAKYYVCPLRKVLKVILPPSIRKLKDEKKMLFVKPLLTLEKMKELSTELKRSSPQQAEVLDVLLKNQKGLYLKELTSELRCSKSPIETLAKKNILEIAKVASKEEESKDFEYFLTKAKRLSDEQQTALKAIVDSISSHTFKTYLLYGITGSGKTEVYLQAIQKALDLGKNVIFLVPEISLASQTLERIKSRFDDSVATLHHRLSPKERADAWQKIKEEKIRIVIGARSAIFAPVPNIGLIIVDEEHEGAYKQTEETPCYSGRDVAIMRAKFASATIVLGSATPSLESFYNALQGKYHLLRLSKRAQEATLANVHIVDMAKEFQKAKGFTLFSEKVLEGIKKRLETGEQTLLFLNRRGYHSQQMCSNCGHIIKCPHCSISLTYHMGDNVLSCHLCDYHLSPPPRSCPSCSSDDGLKFKGAGTEMVEKALHAIFPGIRTLRLDGDTTRKKGSHEALFRAFRSGKADILIGTQMIAKGLHFPSLTLAAVLYADAGLTLPDFRASEQNFQLLLQVSGRAGRGALHGEVIFQTHIPDSHLIRFAANQDYESFYQEEIGTRELFHYPPFSRLIKILVYGKSEEKTLSYGKNLRSFLINKLPSAFEIQPIVASGYQKVKDNFRFQFLIKSQNISLLHKALNEADEKCFKPFGIERVVDVDPLFTYL